MTLISVIGACVAVVALASTLVWLLWWLPLGWWRFEHAGHTLDVVNYAARERVWLDGELVAGTRVDGDHLTWALHRVALPEGGQLAVQISSSNGLSMDCAASVDGRTIFDSRGGAGAAPTEALPTDPRWPAAAVLLAEIARHPDDASAAATLDRALRGALDRLERTRAAAAAHRALRRHVEGSGAGADDAGDAMVEAKLGLLLEHRQTEVDEILVLVSELHLASTGRDLGGARAVAARLAAEREVDPAVDPAVDPVVDPVVDRASDGPARARRRAWVGVGGGAR
jgi:hypothetical protein